MKHFKSILSFTLVVLGALLVLYPIIDNYDVSIANLESLSTYWKIYLVAAICFSTALTIDQTRKAKPMPTETYTLELSTSGSRVITLSGVIKHEELQGGFRVLMKGNEFFPSGLITRIISNTEKGLYLQFSNVVSFKVIE